MSDQPKTPAPDKERYVQLTQEVAQYRKEVADLRTQLDAERQTRIDAQRTQQLTELRYQFAFDLDKELARCKYGKMSDEQFTEHAAVIRENYRQIPVGEALPVATNVPTRDSTEGEKAKYAIGIADKALAIARKRQDEGKPPRYADILADLKAGKDVSQWLT